MQIPWTRDKKQVWNKLSEQMEKRPRQIVLVRRPVWPRLAIAASIILLLGLTGFLRFYTKSIECLPGGHLSMVLPDGSKVDLNAGTELSYHPFWWGLSRSVKLNGEAFFEVEKGKKFEVVSNSGITRVLGTSFNVYAREGLYKVACFSGSVEVVSRIENDAVILNPNEMAIMKESGTFLVQSTETHIEPSSWRQNNFIFTAVPLAEVFSEIERQYNIIIKIPEDLDYLYTGNFTRLEQVEDILNLVCKPFGLMYVEETKGHYKVWDK